MATPFKDPRTGIFHFRRVIPAALRPFFNGASSEYKRTRKTRDPDEARQRYYPHAVIYEHKLAAAQRALGSQQLRSARVMVHDFLDGQSNEQLRSVAQKLAALELGAFEYANGLTDHAPGARYDFGVPPDLDNLRDHASRTAMLNAVPDFIPLPWLETLQRVAALPTLDPIEWLIAAVASANALSLPLAPELYEAIGRAYLDRLCAACALSIDPARSRILPPSVLVTGSGAVVPALSQLANEPQLPTPPVKTVPTISQVYEAWAKFEPRDAKLVDEWRTAVNRFVQLHDDPPVDQITASMVRAYRRTCSGLPSRAKKKVTALPLLEQVELAEAKGLPKLANGTVNKALSAIRVTLEHAVEEMEVIEDNIAKTVKSLPTNSLQDPLLPFEPEDMARIFNAPLPERDGVAPRTLFWALMLAAFTGCRLEELGKLRPGNIKTDDGIPYIAIEPDRLRVRQEQEGPAKRMKTASAKRDVPLHSTLLEAGFLDMVNARRAEGAEWLFPELEANAYGSRTQRLSRVLNDFLDAIGLSDPELVFYSFRHTGKRAVRGKVLREIVDLLFGHADGSVSTLYGRGAEMTVLRDAVEKIQYPSVDWQPVIATGRKMT
ncbi:site-specific integrase [Sphingomonas sanguinis]|uniref:site-specific integrase n=1 Tax=Sphingomonas sp. LC-1 TaxID=3110957 RepID=UPI0021BA68AF|nr:site-specific integrase [Sphingomonas sp. LC-1]MCT8002794.1 site-specific integrase [Sphingomonas sp. LC-1]